MLAASALAFLVSAPAQAGYVTFGSGFGSKWDDPVHGNPATITWGFVTDGATVDPAFFIADEVQGGSDVTRLALLAPLLGLGARRLRRPTQRATFGRTLISPAATGSTRGGSPAGTQS